MRLINTTTLEVVQFSNDNVPPYAILSHVWEVGEVLFHQLDEAHIEEKAGYRKVLNFCSLAKAEGFEYGWIDTWCMDRRSSAELSEAINSMYRWFQQAEVCYAYLADVPADNELGISFSMSRWFTRGWTLQELLAPSKVIFLNWQWAKVGTKSSLAEVVSKTTGIPVNFLLGDDLGSASVAQRMSWASKRETRQVEDMSYCLMGIFGINIPMIAGEGEHAFVRLQEEILKTTHDLSLFAWKSDPEAESNRGFLATSPAAFVDSGNIVQVDPPDHTGNSIDEICNGIRLNVRLMENIHDGSASAILPCAEIGKENLLVVLSLRRSFSKASGWWRDQSEQFNFINLRDVAASKYRRTRILVRYVTKLPHPPLPLRPVQLELKAGDSSEEPEHTVNTRPTVRNSESIYAKSTRSEAGESDEVFSTKLSRASSSVTMSSLFSDSPIPENIVGQFLAILVSDDVLQPLYIEALRGKALPERRRFEAKFVVLLERYQKDLVSQGPDEEEKRVVWLLQQQRKQFERFISEQFGIDGGNQSGKWASLTSQEPDKLGETERYLSSLNLRTDSVEEDRPHADDNEVDHTDEALKSYPTYERLKSFLTDGTAFLLLREGLRQLVRTEASDHLYPILESETDQETMVWKQNLDDSGVNENQSEEVSNSRVTARADLVQLQPGHDRLTNHMLMETTQESMGEPAIDASGEIPEPETMPRAFP